MIVNQRKILVTGATGQQGGSLARLLLQKKHKVYALTRNTQSSAAQDLRNRGANIVKGDLDDSDSLKRAVKGLESVFLMGTPFEDGTEGEARRGQLMADIAKENNIEHLVYSSVANADKNTGIPHFESKYKVEQHIKNLGIPHTIIGPTFFMENLLGPGLEQGQLALPLSSVFYNKALFRSLGPINAINFLFYILVTHLISIIRSGNARCWICTIVLATTSAPKNTSFLHLIAAAKALSISVTKIVSSTILSIVAPYCASTLCIL